MILPKPGIRIEVEARDGRRKEKTEEDLVGEESTLYIADTKDVF